MSLLTDIADYLAANNEVEGVTGWDVYIEHQPPTPDKCLTLIQIAGQSPDQATVVSHSYPELQVRGRGGPWGLEELQTKMDSVAATLNNPTVAGYVYIYPTTSAPRLLRVDRQDQRPEMVIDFKVMTG